MTQAKVVWFNLITWHYGGQIHCTPFNSVPQALKLLYIIVEYQNDMIYFIVVSKVKRAKTNSHKNCLLGHGLYCIAFWSG